MVGLWGWLLWLVLRWGGGDRATGELKIEDLIDGLRAAAPETDFRFAVTSYEDYEGTFEPPRVS